MIVNIPSDIIISNVKITHNIPNFKTESMNLTERTKSRGIHRLEGTLDINIGGSIKAEKAWNAFLVSVQGSYNEFELELPLHFVSENIDTNPICPDTILIGSNQMILNGFTDEVYAGSCFNFDNDSKIYYTKNTVKSGEVVEFFPAARVQQLQNTTIEFIRPKILARFTKDDQPIDFTEAGKVIKVSMDWKEAL